MVAGGVVLRTTRQQDISEAVDGIKRAASIQSEMKWSKYRGGEREKAYKAVIDLFFSSIDENQIHFHCIIAEFAKFSHGAFEGGDPETSVNRIYFQLLVHRICKQYSPKTYIYVFPDQGNDSKWLPIYLWKINAAAHHKYGVGHKIVNIEPTNSEGCNILQMVDIIIGGIAYSCNNSMRPDDKNNHKQQLAKYIMRKSRRSTWLKSTGPMQKRQTVWVFRHQQLVAGPMAPQGARRYIRQG